MADRISWIKNLLKYGTSAEQAAVRDVRQHMIDTGNEKLIIGPTHGPADLSNTLSNIGDLEKVYWPPNHKQWNQQMAAAGEPIYSAHAHPMDSTVVPSPGDFHNWAKDYFVPELGKQGTYADPAKYSRETMWIAGSKDPNLVSMTPPLQYGNYSDTYEILRKLREANDVFYQKMSPDPSTGRFPAAAHALKNDIDNFGAPWLKQLNPDEYAEAYGNLSASLMANKLGEATPIHMDPAGTLVGGHDLPIGDIWPEFSKYVDQIGNPIYKARGGQIPGYAGGGLEHIFDFLKGVTKPIRTYQGSPYKFDKFDPTKIGSGEGSAAYGHGFYSAEAPQVAQEYRRITSHKSDNPAGWMKYGMPVDDLEAQRIIRSLAGMHLPYDEDPRMMDLLAKSVRERMARGENSDQIARGLGQRAGGERYAPENIDAIKQGLPPGYAPKPPGYLYHLDINAHPNQFLDWDAPLDSPANQRIMDRIGDKHMNVVDAMDDVVDRSGYNGISSTPEDYTGRDLHRALSHHEAQEGFPGHIHDEWNDNPKINTASFLSSLDVPGVRFLDKFSRPKNAPYGYDQPQVGTRNYVMFPQSSDLIDIVNREKAEGGQVEDTPFPLAYASQYFDEGGQVPAGGDQTDVGLDALRRMAQYYAKGGQSPDENEFQAFMAFDPSVRDWKNKFQNRYGELPNTISDPTFDYREAYAAGNRPQPSPYDVVPHWDSRGKAHDHQTAWMNDFMQRFGIDPMALQGNQVTPDIQQYMQGQIEKTVPRTDDPYSAIVDALSLMGAYK